MGCGDEQLKPSTWQRAIGVAAIALMLSFVVYPFGSVAQAMATRAIDVDLPSRLTQSFEILYRSGIQALLSTLGTMLIAIPLSRLLARYNFVGRSFIAAALTVPFVIPTVVTGLSVRAAFPAVSPGLGMLLIGHVVVNIAVVINVVMPRWRIIDERLLVQARSLGANPWLVLTKLELPLLRHELSRAAGLIFVFCFSSLGLATVLGDGRTKTLEMQMLRQIGLQLDFTGASVNFVLQSALVLMTLAMSARMRRVVEIPTMDPVRLPDMPLGLRILAFGSVVVVLLPYTLMLRLADWQALRYLPRALQQLGDPFSVMCYSLLVAGVTAVVAVLMTALFATSQPVQITALGYLPLAFSSVGWAWLCC